MKTLAVRPGDATPDSLAGCVLCHDVRGADGAIVAEKGARLDAAAAAIILRATRDELHVLALDPGDLHEEEAGRRLAAAVAGSAVDVRPYGGGQWPLVARERGLLRVDADALAAVNTHAGISVFTLFDGQPVERGETVAKAKVTPLVIGEDTIRSVESGAARGVIAVKRFRAAAIGAAARGNLDARQRARFETALQQKIDWFGARLLPLRFAESSPRAVAGELAALAAAGAEILVVAGASALDPLDPVFGALELLGARMERHGAPAHPGSLLWLARWRGRLVLGMPTCGMFSQATTFDLVLPRILAGETIGNAEIAALGHGGLLSRDMAWRFPAYKAGAARGELE
ncbi:MAG: hypothetical protein HY216_13980 [Candidatus Rokubacteria bacterium]|nr:hypothetical protein [Candidatus Rokubacteria bacterium]